MTRPLAYGVAGVGDDYVLSGRSGWRSGYPAGAPGVAGRRPLLRGIGLPGLQPLHPRDTAIDQAIRTSGVRVWFVYPNPGDTAKVVRAHDQEFSITANTALDNKQTLTRMAHATTTPEAAVFVPERGGFREVYRGRIDDRYLPWELSGHKPRATISKRPSAPCLRASQYRSRGVRRLAARL